MGKNESAATERFNVVVSPETRAQIEQLREAWAADSLAETFRRAVRAVHAAVVCRDPDRAAAELGLIESIRAAGGSGRREVGRTNGGSDAGDDSKGGRKNKNR